MIICLHSNRLRLDSVDHTSYDEINLFVRVLNKAASGAATAIASDYASLDDTMKFIDKCTGIVVFATFDLRPEISDFIDANPDVPVYLVIEDPNWPTSFKINRDYTLLTPFSVFKTLSPAAIKVELETSLDVKLSTFSKHVFIPFGLMQFETTRVIDNNDDEIKKFKSGLGRSHGLITSIYVGSLKNDRIESFKSMIADGVNFYGSFNDNDLLAATGLKDLGRSKTCGRLPVGLVSYAYQYYDIAAFAPDKRMTNLVSCYARLGEMCLAKSNVKLYVGQDYYLEALKQLSDIADYLPSLGAYRISKEKLYAKFLPRSCASLVDYIKEIKLW
jgi:hypothetical protein